MNKRVVIYYFVVPKGAISTSEHFFNVRFHEAVLDEGFFEGCDNVEKTIQAFQNMQQFKDKENFYMVTNIELVK